MTTSTTEPETREGTEAAPLPPVDPRVRDRWVAARRAEGRRRLWFVVVVAALTALLAVAWAITVSPLLDVDHIHVHGVHRTPIAELEHAAGIHYGDALTWLDSGRAVAGMERLPSVLRAEVRREWPGTVDITVVERKPVAWVQGHPGGVAIVDRTGQVLQVRKHPPVGMPQLVGTTISSVPGGKISPTAGAQVAAGLVGLVAAGTKTITVKPSGVSLQLVAGTEIRMGEPTQVEAKIRAALAVLDAMAGTPVSYVDVSVPTNPVAG